MLIHETNQKAVNNKKVGYPVTLFHVNINLQRVMLLVENI